jgi:hypothetical protein
LVDWRFGYINFVYFNDSANSSYVHVLVRFQQADKIFQNALDRHGHDSIFAA